MRSLLPTCVLALAWLAAACQGSAPVAACPPGEPPPTDAAMMLAALKRCGLQIGESLAFTETSDATRLLGRPGGYASKVAFRDTRLAPRAERPLAVDNGGAIEVFAEAGDATLRRDDLIGLGRQWPGFAERTYANGKVVLRLSVRLTPEQAGQYEAALNQLRG